MSAEITARFQRNADGQFVGRMIVNGEERDCWLVFDEGFQPVRDPAFLSLTFNPPTASRAA